MPRIRSVKPEFSTSEQVVSCSRDARLMFILMWCHCDDQGIHPASIVRLKMEVFPGDDLTQADVRGYVDELIAAKLLVEYSSNGESYWLVTGWKHQKIDRPNKKYPLPDSHSTNDRRTIDERSPPEGKGREGMGRESKEGTGIRRSPGSYEEISEEILKDDAELLAWIRNARERFKTLPADADALRVFTAAEHALESGRNAAKAFVAIVKNRSWGEFSGACEDRARERLRNAKGISRGPPGAADRNGISKPTRTLENVSDDQE